MKTVKSCGIINLYSVADGRNLDARFVFSALYLGIGVPLFCQRHKGGCNDETYQNLEQSKFEKICGKRRLRRVPGFLPERLQDELHGGEPVLPEEVNALDAANSRLLPRVFCAF